MQHGVKRGKISKEDEARKKAEDAEQIKQYREMVDDCLNRKERRDYSQEAFMLTNRILDFNPEFYTIWNYRRLILLEGLFVDATPEDRYQLLTSDLRLTTSYLKVHPKVYWIWTHRKWCLEHVPSGPGLAVNQNGSHVDGDMTPKADPVNGHLAAGLKDELKSHTSAADGHALKPTISRVEDEQDNDPEGWKKEAWGRELMLVEKMLDADSRNFHAWDYRRYVLSSLPSTFRPAKTPETEIKYTTKKIESNFSNFSAWHQRTKELGKVWDALRRSGSSEEAEAEIQKMRSREFELVTQALWTDPADQSGWLYHRWLIGGGEDVATTRREISQIKELLEAEPDSKWPLESLVHYTQLLLRAGKIPSEEIANARTDIAKWLQDLERIDPFRKERYRELAAELQKGLI